MRAGIGKTRQGARLEEVYDAGAGRPHGILSGAPQEGAFRHSRRDPPPELADWVDHFWSVQWDLRHCEPFLAETLPHPNVHLTMEQDGSWVGGVRSRKFSRMLRDEGWVQGVKFKAGAFRPFLGRAVSSIREKVIPAGEVFGPEIENLRAGLRWDGPEEARLAAVSEFLRTRLPAASEQARAANGCVRRILEDRELRSVDELAAQSGMSKRSLQRLFQEYVGVPVKWVIRRYRLHDVLDAMTAGGAAPEWARLAVDLGYFDQSHLINDFRSITGYSPADAQARLSGKR